MHIISKYHINYSRVSFFGLSLHLIWSCTRFFPNTNTTLQLHASQMSTLLIVKTQHVFFHSAAIFKEPSISFIEFLIITIKQHTHTHTVGLECITKLSTPLFFIISLLLSCHLATAHCAYLASNKLSLLNIQKRQH